jgi:hypothetical protein
MKNKIYKFLKCSGRGLWLGHGLSLRIALCCLLVLPLRVAHAGGYEGEGTGIEAGNGADSLGDFINRLDLVDPEGYSIELGLALSEASKALDKFGEALLAFKEMDDPNVSIEDQLNDPEINKMFDNLVTSAKDYYNSLTAVGAAALKAGYSPSAIEKAYNDIDQLPDISKDSFPQQGILDLAIDHPEQAVQLQQDLTTAKESIQIITENLLLD